MSIMANEVTISRHCKFSCARVLYRRNGFLQCRTRTSKRVEQCCSSKLDVNADVSSDRIGPQDKVDVNASQPKRSFADLAIVDAANAIGKKIFSTIIGRPNRI